MLVAVTGGTGFIGKHLIKRHLAFGDQVRYLTRNHESNELNGASAYIGNLNSSVEHLQQFLDGVEVLYHCAAELRDEAEMHNTNVLGTANLLAAARDKICRWVQLSSTGVYGKVLNTIVSEDSTLRPDNVYEKSKSTSDLLVLDAIKNQSLQGVILRPSVVYGTDMPNQSLFQLIKMIDRNMFFFVGKEGAIVNYVHVDNVVDALVLCATSPLAVNDSIYIVSDHCTVEELVKIIAVALDKIMPKKRLPESVVRAVVSFSSILPSFPLNSSRVDALTNRTVYVTNHIQSELGFKRSISMEMGISELTRYYKNRQVKYG